MDKQVENQILSLIEDYRQGVYRRIIAEKFGDASLLVLHRKPSLKRRILNKIGR